MMPAVRSQPESSALATDLYEYTMAAGYFLQGMQEVRATFELFFRQLPVSRNFLISCGQELALDFISRWRITDDELAYLRSLPVLKSVPDGFFRYLKRLRFTGDVWAMPEGTPVFPNEPILRVSAPIIEAQLMETALLAFINHSTAIASKAVRVVLAARGRDVVEFGARRAHGTQAAKLGARAAYIVGCIGTSNLECGREFGIPVFGTVAHSWVQAFDDELAAFRANLDALPEAGVMLIDTYDTLEGARKAVLLGKRLKAVRLDSGDLIALSKKVRRILDKAGLSKTTIFLSGDLDEYRIDEILRKRTPADAFGVGTRMIVSIDAPVVNGVYKLVEVIRDGRVSGRVKLSADKVLYPGKKQVLRYSRDSIYSRDVVCSADERLRGAAHKLLKLVIRHGNRVREPEPLEAIRSRVKREVARLPRRLHRLDTVKPYPVEFSRELERRLEKEAASVRSR